MRDWTEAQWAEWRAERAAMLLEGGSYEGPNVMEHVGQLEAIERLRLRCEARWARGDGAATPKHKQMEMPI